MTCVSRTLLVLTALLATALPVAAEDLQAQGPPGPEHAKSERGTSEDVSATLFEDPAGDVGPWPTMIVGAGLPGPGDADLLGATLDGDLLTLSLVSLAEVPPHRLWAVGWTLEDERYVAAGYASTAEGGAAVCVWEKAGEFGPEGEPECTEIASEVVTGSPGSFAFTVPGEFLSGPLASPDGIVMEMPEDVAEPLVFLSYTGLTMLDAAYGSDLPAAVAAEEPVTTASAAGSEAPRAVPGVGFGGLLAGAAVAFAFRRR